MLKKIPVHKSVKIFPMLAVVLVFSFCARNILAQDVSSAAYVPLIGITSVPEPLSLPGGAGNITYNYAVKNFLREAALTDVKVVDDACAPVKFIEGDDNHDSKLDFNETWRYTCSTEILSTTSSIATATGIANNLTTSDKAHATVIVGTTNPVPLVSIVNVTKISNPTPAGNINFTYKVTNPGAVSLSNVSVTDDKCIMSGKLGDVNDNNLLDTNEVWIYSCTAAVAQSTTDTANVTALANGLLASDEATMSINIDNSIVAEPSPLFDVSISPDASIANPNLKVIVWGIMSVFLFVLVIFFFLKRKKHE